jgi:hypothetical protein
MIADPNARKYSEDFKTFLEEVKADINKAYDLYDALRELGYFDKTRDALSRPLPVAGDGVTDIIWACIDDAQKEWDFQAYLKDEDLVMTEPGRSAYLMQRLINHLANILDLARLQGRATDDAREKERAYARGIKDAARWLAAQASALRKLDREPEKREAFVEAHNAILTMLPKEPATEDAPGETDGMPG